MELWQCMATPCLEISLSRVHICNIVTYLISELEYKRPIAAPFNLPPLSFSNILSVYLEYVCKINFSGDTILTASSLYSSLYQVSLSNRSEKESKFR